MNSLVVNLFQFFLIEPYEASQLSIAFSAGFHFPFFVFFFFCSIRTHVMCKVKSLFRHISQSKAPFVRYERDIFPFFISINNRVSGLNASFTWWSIKTRKYRLILYNMMNQFTGKIMQLFIIVVRIWMTFRAYFFRFPSHKWHFIAQFTANRLIKAFTNGWWCTFSQMELFLLNYYACSHTIIMDACHFHKQLSFLMIFILLFFLFLQPHTAQTHKIRR